MDLQPFLDSDLLEWKPDGVDAKDALFYVEFKYFKKLYKLYRPHAPSLKATDLTDVDMRLRLEKKTLRVPLTLRKYRTLWCIGTRPSAEATRQIFPASSMHTHFQDFLDSDYLEYCPYGVPSPSEAIDAACGEGECWYMPKTHFDKLYTEFQQKEHLVFTSIDKLTCAQLSDSRYKSKFCFYHGRLYDPHLKTGKLRFWIIGLRQNPSRGWTIW